jgi:S-adenosylmethionine/arginine decarboxylase-like enzyme
MIETSHIAMHVWDQEKPALAQIDVYSCKHYDHIKVVKAIEEMNPTRIQWHRINRREEIKLMESVDRMC